VRHYLLFGVAEGRQPNAWFNATHYLEANPDVAMAGINPLLHYMLHRQGRPPRLLAQLENVLAPAADNVSSLEDLPWQFTGQRLPGSFGRIIILLTSHNASRTGAPLALLSLLGELTGRSEFECWVLLNTGGPLEADFARHAPTLNLGALIRRGAARQATLDLIASLFQRYVARGVALCNTAATPDINLALARQGVPVVSWVHELPTSIDAFFGGEATFRTIFDASRSMILPAKFVRDALVRHYRCNDPTKLQVLYYGIAAQYDALPREQTRRAVRDELGMPPDALLVLNCGAVDLRKGADLFVHIAGRLLASTQGARLWFVWRGAGTMPRCSASPIASCSSESVRTLDATLWPPISSP
jgi:hypothetical protein